MSERVSGSDSVRRRSERAVFSYEPMDPGSWRCGQSTPIGRRGHEGHLVSEAYAARRSGVSASSARKRRFARDMYVFTVPIGISSASAISR